MPRLSTLTLALSAMLLASQAGAHTGHDAASGLASGLMHPIMGWDHVAAMVAVGLWASLLGGQAMWRLPVVFPVVMALGGALGMWGMAMPAVEAGIALSGVVLGLLIAFAVRAPLAVSAAVVGVFALFHGHAHGTELPAAVSPLGYGAGFLVGTGLLHLSGIALGLAAQAQAGRVAMRVAGGTIALAGGVFLLGAVS